MAATATTKTEILDALMHVGKSTAQELAQSLQVSPQAIRRHLKDLEDEHLIAYEIQQAGVGRPQNVYALTENGRARLRTLPQQAQAQNEFAVELLETLAETIGPAQMEQILAKQWQRKAAEYRSKLIQANLEEKLQQLVQLRRAEGYSAECFPLESEAGQTFVLTEYNCAIANIAKTFPAVCEHELEMFAAALPNCQVERTHWLVEGEHRCGYLISKL